MATRQNLEVGLRKPEAVPTAKILDISYSCRSTEIYTKVKAKDVRGLRALVHVDQTYVDVLPDTDSFSRTARRKRLRLRLRNNQ